jgi:hypothetical protein
MRKVSELDNSELNIYLLSICFNKDVTKLKQDDILIIYIPYDVPPYPELIDPDDKKPAFKGLYKAKDDPVE